jgi:hypothetical protein
MSTRKLTKSYIDKLPIPERDKVFHRDTELKGFGLYVRSSDAKVFIVEKRINGKVKRITLGRYGELTAEQARKQAQAVLGKIAIGHDPIAEKKEQALKAVTLGQVFEDYLKARSSLKPTTVFDYRRVMRESFPDWQDKPILLITKDKVEKRHKELGERSLARANLSMRVLRALFNFAMGKLKTRRAGLLLPRIRSSVYRKSVAGIG